MTIYAEIRIVIIIICGNNSISIIISRWKITSITVYSEISGKESLNVMNYTDVSSLRDNITGPNGTSTYLATAYPYQTDSSITYPTDYKELSSAYPGLGKIFGDAIWENIKWYWFW